MSAQEQDGLKCLNFLSQTLQSADLSSLQALIFFLIHEADVAEPLHDQLGLAHMRRGSNYVGSLGVWSMATRARCV